MQNNRTIARALLRQLAPWEARECMQTALEEGTGLQGFIRLASKLVELNEKLVNNL